MSGNKYLLDTNAIIALLDGNTIITNKLDSAYWVGTSVLCIIEFLSFSNLSASDKILLYKLTERITVIPIENDIALLEHIGDFRAQTKLKTPDAVIPQMQ